MSAETAAAEPLSPLPRRLSPSRANDYSTCPKMFYFKTVERLTSPPTVATTTGTLSHLVFEKIFDLPRDERTLEVALSMVEDCWALLLNPDEDAAPYLKVAAEGHAALAPAGSVELDEIFAGARASIEGWFQMENPSRFDPEGREVELEAEFDGFRFGGILDRLDCYTGRLEGDEEPRKIWVISDYKSGKLPSERYDPGLKDTFRPMALYAALVKEQLGIEVDLLRLVYVRTGDRVEGVKTVRATRSVRENAVARMKAIRQGIEKSHESGSWAPKPGPLCGYCPFVKLCPEGAAEAERRAELKASREAENAALAAV